MLKLRNVISGIVATLIIIGMMCAVVYRQQLMDQIRVWQYQPTSDIIALADRTSLSERGTFYFYLAHPQLEQADTFNQECRRAEPASALLGCYKQASETIHIYNVTDPALKGVEEVTAAHEMLHVAYGRLSAGERKRLSPLLEATYEKVKTTELEDRMAYYERAQPGSRENELHSILGTEYAEISEELERYYSQYFIDRSAVVKWYDAYHRQFKETERQANELTEQLQEQRKEIDQTVAQYERDIIVYNQDVTSFNQRAETGGFATQQEFSEQRVLLQGREEQLEATRQNISAQIEIYNVDVERLNAMGREIERFNNSLDSMKAVE